MLQSVGGCHKYASATPPIDITPCKSFKTPVLAAGESILYWLSPPTVLAQQNVMKSDDDAALPIGT